MIDLQRDIELVDFAMRLESHEFQAAWQRLKPRLTPDRGKVARAMRDVEIVIGLDDETWRELADAAIDAAREKP